MGPEPPESFALGVHARFFRFSVFARSALGCGIEAGVPVVGFTVPTLGVVRWSTLRGTTEAESDSGWAAGLPVFEAGQPV